MNMNLPVAVAGIIERLEELGHEAFAVGGCVRDTILGREPEDWDITTSAKPMEIKKAFARTIDTGIQHGTVTVMIDHVGYEVTTYRIDGEYEDNRHPAQVEFTTNLCRDLERRDFTINAMAYNKSQGLVDEFDGIGDLERGVIRCVGDPDRRFDEDALRMLRAVRFSGQLGFAIEKNTRRAIVERAHHLEHISAERIRVELTKLLVSKDAGQLREAVATGMTKIFLPELDRIMPVEQKNPHHIATVGEHSIHSIEMMNCFFGKIFRQQAEWENVPEKVRCLGEELAAGCSEKEHTALCMTMLLHDVAKPDCMTVDEEGIGHFYGHPRMGEKTAGRILRRLTFDNETTDLVKRLIRWHDDRIEPSLKAVRKAAAKRGRDIMPLLFLVRFADILAQNPEEAETKLEEVLAVKKVYQEVLETEAPLSLKELAVTGRDLMELGMEPGPQIGEILKMLLEEVLEEPERNIRETLLELAKEKIGKQGSFEN